MDALQEIQSEHQQRQQQAEIDFQELARAVAIGEGPEASDVLDQLARLNKTPADLERAVTYWTERLQWAAEAACLAERSAAADEAQLAIESYDRETTLLVEERANGRQSLQEALNESNAARSRSYVAINNLRRHYRGPALVALTSLQQRERELVGQLNAAKDRRSRAKWYARGPLATSGAVRPKDVKTCEDRITAADDEIRRIESQIEDCRQQAKRIEMSMLQP